MREDGAIDSSAVEAQLSLIPKEIVQTFSKDQRAAVASALREARWKRHPIDVRFSMPFIGRRFYVTLIAGEEKRSAERRRLEREMRPVGTMGNFMFVLGIAALFYLVAIVGIFFYSEVLEF